MTAQQHGGRRQGAGRRCKVWDPVELRAQIERRDLARLRALARQHQTSVAELVRQWLAGLR